MFSTKKEIIDYHEELRNKIDLKSEQLLQNLSRSNQNNFERSRIINSVRESLINKVTEIESFNLFNLSKQTKFCFFVSNSKILNDKTNDDKKSSCFKNDIGILILLNIILPNKTLNLIEKLINENTTMVLNEPLDSFKDFITIKVILCLVESKCHDMIVDLTTVEDNITNNLDFVTDEYSLDREDDLGSLPRLLNLEKVGNIDLTDSCKKANLPNGIFTPEFKYITNLVLSYSIIGVIRERTFVNLENLSELEITDCEIKKFENNAFFGLKNLKKLDSSFNCIEELNKEVFNGLDSLEILNLRNNRINCLETDNFIYLKNLVNLSLSENPLEEIEINCFNGLSKLKILSFNNVTTAIEHAPKNLLEPLKSIEILDFTKCFIIDELTPFKPSDNLKFLGIIHNVEFVNEFRNLEYLDVFNCGPDIKISQISLENLKFLGIKVKEVEKFGNNFKNLQALKIKNVLRFAPDWSENLKSLEYLKVQILNSILRTEDFEHLKNMKYFKIMSYKDLKSSFKSNRDIFMNMFEQKEKVKVSYYTVQNGYDNESDQDKNDWRCTDLYLEDFDSSLCFLQLKECASERNYFEEMFKVSKIILDNMANNFSSNFLDRYFLNLN